MKITYRISGSLLLIAAVTMFSWFYSDLAYFFTNPGSYTSQVRFIIFVATALFGAFYFFYGIKAERINRLSNLSLVVLVTTLVLTYIMIYPLGCHVMGGTCPAYTIVAQYIFLWVIVIGPLASAILAIGSMMKKKVS